MAAPIIKIKRSAVPGKLPSISDLNLGELALNTYDGHLYTTKNVGAGNTVIVVNPFRVGSGTDSYDAYFTQGNIGIGTDNPTVKLDVNGNVNVSGIVTATSFSGGGGSITGVNASQLNSQNAAYYLDYSNFTNTPTIPTNNNQLTNGAGYVTANTQLSNEQVQDIVGGMVSGNTESGITVTYEDSDGTLDFSVASQTDNNFTTTLKNKLDGIEASADVTDATNVNAAGAVMNSDSTTASMSFVIDEDNMSSNSATKVPTQQSVKAYVDSEVSSLVDAAPGALDTLNELASAINDDANFSTTITNSIATKLPLAGGTMTGNIVMSGTETVDGRDLSADGTKLDGIETGATADQTKADIDALGIDADQLDGQEGSYYLNYNNFTNTPTIPTNNNQLTNGAGYVTSNTQLSNEQVQDIVGGMVSSNTESGITVTYQDGDGTLDFSVASQTDNNFTTTLKNKLDGIEASATADQSAAEIRTLVESATDSNVFTDADHSKLNGIEASATADQTAAEILTAIKTVDGAGSGLDADLLDGQQGSHYLNYNNFTNTPTIPTNNNQLTNGAGYVTSNTQLSNEQVQDIVGGMVSSNTESGITVTYEDSDGTLDFSVASQTDNNFTTTLKNKLDGIEASATADQTAAEILTAIKTVDGSGSGLDADTLDGVQASSFLRSDAADTATGLITLTNGLHVTSGDVGIGTATPGYKLEVNGSFAATTKSFVIPHPTKQGYKLRYGSLEGPENGVYVRGQSKDLIINLPDYWTKLVDPNSITVNLTPIGDSAQPRVRQIENNTVEIFSKEEGELNYFYTVFAERVDVESLEVEINCSEID